MICSKCRTSYSSPKNSLSEIKTLRGLCKSCGTEPIYQGFYNEFTKVIWAAFASIELYLILFAIYGDWFVFIAYAMMTALVHVCAFIVVKESDPVSYASESERKTKTRKYRFMGFAGGLLASAIQFLVFTGLV